MSEAAESQHKAHDLDPSQARLAYNIIEGLLRHAVALNDLVAAMAQALDQDTTKLITDTEPWQAYMESKRSMELIHTQVEEFTVIMQKLSED